MFNCASRAVSVSEIEGGAKGESLAGVPERGRPAVVAPATQREARNAARMNKREVRLMGKGTNGRGIPPGGACA